MKKQVSISVLGLALALLAAGCGKTESSRTEPAKKPVVVVQAVMAEKRDLSRVMLYTGSIEPVKVARMASPAEGPIMACAVREGDRVEAGQLLARVGRSRMADTALEAASEELRRQAAEYKRVEQLVKSGSLAGEQIEAARSNLKRAEAQVAAMETGAGDYEIKAPWAGVVSKIWIADGNYVSPRTPLVEMYDPASLVVRFPVPEKDMPFIHAGAAVRVKLDAYPGRGIPAEVVRIYPELERATRTVTVEAELRGEARLLSGLFARVEAPLRTVKDAVVAPEAALVVLPGGENVVFVLSGETAVRRPVKVALEAGGFIAVESGLEAGERVVTRGQEALKEGLPVRVMGEKGRPPS
ncbi:MAG: efflux RND transporter periplasmic adaptor subunit [Kiritimatiellia bacterium]